MLHQQWAVVGMRLHGCGRDAPDSACYWFAAIACDEHCWRLVCRGTMPIPVSLSSCCPALMPWRHTVSAPANAVERNFCFQVAASSAQSDAEAAAALASLGLAPVRRSSAIQGFERSRRKCEGTGMESLRNPKANPKGWRSLMSLTDLFENGSNSTTRYAIHPCWCASQNADPGTWCLASSRSAAAGTAGTMTAGKTAVETPMETATPRRTAPPA